MSLITYYLLVGLIVSYIIFYLVDKFSCDKIQEFTECGGDSDLNKLKVNVTINAIKDRSPLLIYLIVPFTILWPLVLFGMLLMILGNYLLKYGKKG